MMIKKVLVALGTVALIGGLSSCKPKESAYKAAWERAKQREIAREEEQKQDEIIPVVVSNTNDSDVRTERVTPAAGEDPNGLKDFSVVIGSFQNATNARSLKERMNGEGYNATIAQNEQGMYRVIVTTFDTKEEAIRSRETIKNIYAPSFQDAWILLRSR